MKLKISPKEFYTSIYKELDYITPLKVDCGKLCDNACCVVTDEITGMYLFPCEEVMYSPMPEWGKIYDTDFECESGKIDLITCIGHCDREKRPLSCRIFPLIPRVEKDGSFKLVMDPRGREMCPLCKAMRVDELDEEFVKAVEKAMKKCMLIKECRNFLCALSDEIFF